MEAREPLVDDDELTPNEHALENLRSMYSEVGFVHPEEWMKAPAVLGEDGLTLAILNHPVMETWEDNYMELLAEIATSNGGRVLEVGFGMGRSSRFIHNNPRVTHHVIVEANHDIANLAREFARNSSIDVTVIEGLRDDVLKELEPCSFDGMLNDTYPLNEREINAQELCAPLAYRVLRKGGVLTYFSDEPDRFRPKHLKTLLDAGFQLENIKGKLIKVAPPDTCRYWNVNSILAPIVIK
jgi:guanidinoacetate N-methyltransferase